MGGREIRRVPSDWKHPLRDGETWTTFPGPHARFQPQHEAEKPYVELLREYLAEYEKWERGERPDTDNARACTHYHEYAGGPPNPDFYSPYWPAEQRTHYQMYECTSEGTPISPVFATPEEVARWCVDNGASIFGRDTTTYETWLNIARGSTRMIGMVTTGAGWDHLIVPTDKK